MVINNFLKDCLVFSIVFIPPLVIFIRFWNERGKSIWGLVAICTFYIIVSPFTQNLLPFILVLMDILFIKENRSNPDYYLEFDVSSVYKSTRTLYKSDYARFNFNIRNFKMGSAFKYSIYSYALVIFMTILSNIIFSLYRMNLKEQDVVSWMAGLPMWEFLVVAPIAIIFAPVVEEFVFRWFLFEKVFSARTNIIVASIISSLIFALVHFNIASFPIILCIGLFNCYLIHKKGFWYSVFNHSIFNFVTTFALFLAKLGIIA